jgi:aspartate/methionine/tyrosine aminotransferase
MFVPNGTNAIFFAAWWLKSLGVETLIVLCPTYFSIFYACNIIGLRCKKVFMNRDNGVWRTPFEKIRAMAASNPSKIGIWVTNPVYCAGVYLDSDEAEFVNALSADGVAVVVDECLSLNGRELGRKVNFGSRAVGLYSPHKSLCMNAVKFAAIIFDNVHLSFFTDWADIFVGGLGTSNYAAIHHFLSPNFPDFQKAFLREIAEVRRQVVQVIKESGRDCRLDTNSDGYFMTCYAPLGEMLSNEKSLLRQMVLDTGVVIIPGSRNHFDPAIGFNFRINLARGCPQFFSALRRCLRFLTNSR